MLTESSQMSAPVGTYHERRIRSRQQRRQPSGPRRQ